MRFGARRRSLEIQVSVHYLVTESWVIIMEEEWQNVSQEQSSRLVKAVSALGSVVGSNVNVDPAPYLRLILELLQSHHDSLYTIRLQHSEIANSITALENRLALLEEK